MKITFEFDTDSELFDSTELETFYQANHLRMCISDILDKLRSWEKYDNRDAIPVDEIRDTIVRIVNENCNLEKLGY